MQKFNFSPTENILQLYYKDQSVNVLYEKNYNINRESYEIRKYVVWAECKVFLMAVHIVTSKSNTPTHCSILVLWLPVESNSSEFETVVTFHGACCKQELYFISVEQVG